MLPFALKAVWFALCALGTVATWFVLWFMAKSTNCYWLPILYCVGLSILEGIFCLGMIYHMDPYQMPRSFCLSQIFTISFSALLLTGICLTVILAVTTAIIQPASLSDASPQSTLRWKWAYLVPLVVIPVTFASLQLALVIKYDAYSPSDNIHCDVTGPHLWLSLLGYAGMPALESIPCLGINVLAMFRVYKTYTSHKQTIGSAGIETKETITSTVQSTVFTEPSLGPAPLARSMPHSTSFASLEEPSPLMLSPRSSLYFAKVGRAPPSPQFRPRAELSPLRYNSQSPSRPISCAGSSLSKDRYPPSIVSSTAPSARPWSFAESLEAPAHQLDQIEEADISSILDAYDSTASLTQHRATAGCFARSSAAEPLKEEEDVGDTPDPKPVSWDELSRIQAAPPSQASFMSLIWRLILFFLFFFLVQILVTLSTIIDVSRGKDALTPFGTQHVALLLAAWGPSAVFGHAPGIRSHLIFWR